MDSNDIQVKEDLYPISEIEECGMISHKIQYVEVDEAQEGNKVAHGVMV